jgi:hypothetical protein
MSPDKIFLNVNGRSMSLAKLVKNPAIATVVRVLNCAGLSALPDLPNATVVWVDNCAGLSALPDLPNATDVWVLNCAGLSALPDLPNATVVWVLNCAGLSALYAGKDSRNYQFYAVKIRGLWRVVAGCRNLSFDDARAHWGPGGVSNRPDCLALVEKLAVAVSESEAA